MDFVFEAICDAVLADPMPSGVWVARREITSHFRNRAHVEARALVAELCRRHLRDPSYPVIGRLMNRCHSSIMHLTALVEASPDRFARNLAAAEARLFRHLTHFRRDTMRVTLRSTNEFSFVNGTRCRVWTGTSDGGVQCVAFIPLVAVSRDQDQGEFARELLEQPHEPHGTHFDMRNVI